MSESEQDPIQRTTEVSETLLDRVVDKLIEHPWGRMLLRPLTRKRTTTVNTGEQIKERTIEDVVPKVVDVKVKPAPPTQQPPAKQ